MAGTWIDRERQLANGSQSWETISDRLENVSSIVEDTIQKSQSDITKYPRINGNGKSLSQLLANLNYYVQLLGEIHATTEALSTWAEKRYEIEKGLELHRLTGKEKMGVTQAGGAKYERVQEYLDTMVKCVALNKRVQNARSSARDTTEAVRSRIGQLRGQMRAS